MSEFKRYNDIENSYQQKNILKHLEYNPKLKTMKFVAREKLDGANISILLTSDGSMKVGKRTSWLNEGESFFDMWNTLARYEGQLQVFKCMAQDFNVFIRLFGEIYGPGINGRIDYGPEKRIAIFDMYIGDELVDQSHLEDFFYDYGVGSLLPPLVGYYDGIDKALDAQCDFDSKVLNKPGNQAEGIVIQPYDEVIRMPNRERFILKKKNDKFLETMSVKKPKAEMDGETLKAVMTFSEYINENRILNAFSKLGPIKEPSQMGDYIRFIREDAIKDFMKDYPDLVLNEDTQKKVFNVGKTIALMLRSHL